MLGIMSEQVIERLARWSHRIERVHPLGEREEEEARYVPLDDLRGGGVFEELVSGIRLSARSGERESTRLLVGGRGVGKSTELRRVARALERQEGLVVLRVDLGRYGAWSQAPTAEALRAKLALGIRETASTVLGGRGRGSGMDPREVVAELVEHVAPRRLVLLVDGLDEMALPMGEIARGAQQFAEILLGKSQAFMLPGCMTVYVVSDHLVITNPSMALVFGDPVQFLPAVRLEEETVHRLEQVLAGWVDLDEMFGEERPERVHRLAMLSGGNLGVFGQLVMEVIRTAEARGLPAGEDTIEEAVTCVRSRLMIFTDGPKVLRGVRDAMGLHLTARAEIGILAEAMHHGAVQNYWGGAGGETIWQGVHPLV